MKKIINILLFITIPYFGFSQQYHQSIDLTEPLEKITSDHLKLGGTNSENESIEVNNFYMSRNGKPFIPITGEFHFSRYPKEYWDEAIKKMKAGGINVIATYVFWIMHEEEEGEFIWSGDRDLREFVELCAENDLPVVIRIGPFCHGEIRNGGMPDWLLAKPLTIRSNDPKYLFYAERLYNEIGDQLEGLYFKDGGPIIATQIENEYQHSAAPWGLKYPGQPYDMTSSERDRLFTKEGVGISLEDNPYADLGNEHMKVLKSLAINAGIETPLYTATGWGNAAIVPNESIPVTAAYAYPTWTEKADISPFYLYKYMHKNPDYSPVRYIPENYPAFAAELGGGIMSTYNRRPLVPAESLDALINRCLGSGANGIGYYMYHGGSTPKGKHSFFNDEAYGYPKISYDFQAPIGEFGKIRDSYHRLKLLHEFIKNFGNMLAPMQTVIPESNDAIDPTNTEALRYSVRHDGNSGFIFLNNFQDDTLMSKKENIQIAVKTAKSSVSIPAEGGFDLMPNENAIFPFNFDLDGLLLNYATAQLFTKFSRDNVQYYVFFNPEGVKPEFSIKDKSGVTIENSFNTSVEKKKNDWIITAASENPSEFVIQKTGGSHIKILTISKELALDSWIVNLEDEKQLVFSEAVVLQNNERDLALLSTGQNSFELFTYPKLEQPAINHGNILNLKDHDLFAHYQIELPKLSIGFTSNMVNDKRLVVDLAAGIPETLNDVIMKIDYTGDTAMGFLNNELVTDEFYKGIPWEIGLRKFVNLKQAEEMNFYIRPIYENASFLVDLEDEVNPSFEEKKVFTDIREVEFIPEYKTTISF